MSDFFLDFREPEIRRRSAGQAAASLKFCEDTEVRTFDRGCFTLVLTRVDGFDLWGPCEGTQSSSGLFVALAGRIALSESEWDASEKVEATGGTACKAILEKYLRGGTAALASLNGNFTALVHDGPGNRFHLVTDRCGMFIAYRQGENGDARVFCSHPDALADVAGGGQDLDRGSLAEFLMTSQVSFPHTYFRNISALETGSIFSFDLQPHFKWLPRTQYFSFDFKIDPHVSEGALAEELATAFRNAVRRRTLPAFGRTGVGLSGGLDLRAILSTADPRSQPIAFTLFDEENAEFRTARAIAEACQVPFLPIERDFEFYGRSAELGVRASAGTGCISCNHFLSARDQFKAAGITNLLTGCYCDYIFKGLAFNRREDRLSCADELDGFEFEFYDSFHWLKTPFRDEVMARLHSRFPESNRKDLSEVDWLEIERKRTFPLAYEQDLAQRVIPQRLMPWYVPLVDNDLIAVYLKIPPRFKLNSSIFKKMLGFLCPAPVLAVPDSNTNSAINASWPQFALKRYWSSVRDRIEDKMSGGMATSGSWPNWRHYLRHSEVIARLWERPDSAAKDLFTAILGENPFVKNPGQFASADPVLFQRLLTQKLWLDQRA